MKKEQFIKTIEALQKQYEHDERVCDLLSEAYPESTIMPYDNSIIINQILDFLKSEFNDQEDSIIEYFIYELDYGKKYKKGMVTDSDGSEIELKTANDLWDYLVNN